MRHDRLSAYEQFGLKLPVAIRNEFHHGMEVIQSKETFEGATRLKMAPAGMESSNVIPA